MTHSCLVTPTAAPRRQRNATPGPIRVAISSCLLGQSVRYDGGHTRNAYITETLGSVFEFVPFCPEVAIGMGVPRPPIQLVRVGTSLLARGVENPNVDVTDKLLAYADTVAPTLQTVSGYILKSRSPSCGLQQVKTFTPRGKASTPGVGIYAGRLQALCPAMPFEEEGRLMEPAVCENFLERVVVYSRWQTLCKRRLTVVALAGFHARHVLVARAHDEKLWRTLEHLIAMAKRHGLPDLSRRYIELLMQGLKKPTSRVRHARVLQSIAGYFKDHLDAGERRALQAIIAEYRCGVLPRLAVIALLRHHLQRHPDSYLESQYYLDSALVEAP